MHEIVRHGHTVYVETGAGVGAVSAMRSMRPPALSSPTPTPSGEKADLYYKVKELFPQEFKWMNKDKILFTYIHSNAHPDETDTLLNSHVPAVAYEDVQDEEGKFPCAPHERAGRWGRLPGGPCTLPSPSTAAPASAGQRHRRGDPHHHHAGPRRGRYRRCRAGCRLRQRGAYSGCQHEHHAGRQEDLPPPTSPT